MIIDRKSRGIGSYHFGLQGLGTDHNSRELYSKDAKKSFIGKTIRSQESGFVPGRPRDRLDNLASFYHSVLATLV